MDYDVICYDEYEDMRKKHRGREDEESNCRHSEFEVSAYIKVLISHEQVAISF